MDESSLLDQLPKTVKSKSGVTLELFFKEIVHFCCTKECVSDLMMNGSKDFFGFVSGKSCQMKIWLNGYFNAGCEILQSPVLSQEEKDEAVEGCLKYVFDEAKGIFESLGPPIYMCADFGTPFYDLIETCLKVLSEEKCVGIMDKIVSLFQSNISSF